MVANELAAAAVVAAHELTIESAKGKKKPPLMGPIRTNLEAFGVAILAAVLLKWFCIEAYQIPTSSMQPTLMGDNAAGVYDRILVDKLLQTFREPKRWDITVFGYPLQKNQNYVKRMVGMPGDRLRIAGGNVYQVVDGEAGKRTFTVLRKPDDLQEGMWKNVFPARMQRRADTKALTDIFASSPASAGSESDGVFTLTLGSGATRFYFRDIADGGMLDRVWDGYPEAVARAIRDKNPPDQPQEIVPDVRITATVTAEQVPDELAFEIDVTRPDFPKLTYALVVKGGKGKLVVREKDAVVGESAEFACEIPAGSATELAFAHVDDQLIAWRAGQELLRFDSSNWAARDGCVLPFDHATGKLNLQSGRSVTPQIVGRGKGKLTIADLRIDRDQHYTQSGAPDVIEVPEGHYYMLGGNTLQSIDSRGWTAITVGVDAEDRVVPPETPGARVVRGNKRAMPLQNPPDRDETPIPIASENAIVMIDEYGEILRLKGTAAADWGKRVAFAQDGAGNGRGEWVAPETTNAPGISFVPRQDIRGRAVLVFYPCRPLSWLMFNNWPDRFGFVR